jgi:hypothetical protein
MAHLDDSEARLELEGARREGFSSTSFSSTAAEPYPPPLLQALAINAGATTATNKPQTSSAFWIAGREPIRF